ncbi:hypothetical protein [Akkermansia glycaniphila]|nr:hypothetical protein [Akkermansia glycaniphila]
MKEVYCFSRINKDEDTRFLLFVVVFFVNCLLLFRRRIAKTEYHFGTGG